MEPTSTDTPFIPRPAWLTGFCWLILFSSGYNLAGLGLLADPGTQSLWGRNELPIGLTITHVAGGSIVQIVAALALLRRKRWGRTLMLGYLPLAFVLNVLSVSALMGLTVIWGLVYTGGIYWLLTRPSVTEYLTGQRSPGYVYRQALVELRKTQRTSSDGRMVAGLICLAIASFFFLLWIMVFGISRDPGIVVGLVVLAGLPGAGFLWGGVSLIGSIRWAELCGVVLAAAGSMGALYGIMFWSLSRTPYWDEIVRSMNQSTPQFIDFGPTGLHAAVLGLCIGLVGFSLLQHQFHLDRETLENSLSE